MTDVWAAFKQEIALSKYGLEFEYSKCALHLLAGEQFLGDVSVSILSLVATLLS